MDVKVRISDQVGVLDLHGPFTVDSDTRQLPEVVNLLHLMGVDAVILNLRQVSFLDGSGIGQLIICAQTIQGRGGEFRLAEVNSRFRSMIELCGLSDVLKVCGSERVARESLPRREPVQKGPRSSLLPPGNLTPGLCMGEFFWTSRIGKRPREHPVSIDPVSGVSLRAKARGKAT